MIRNDPIELLMATKRHALDCEEFRAWMSVTSNVCHVHLICKQRDDDSLSDCNMHFKAAREVVHSHLGGSKLVPKDLKEIHPQTSESKRTTRVE